LLGAETAVELLEALLNSIVDGLPGAGGGPSSRSSMEKSKSCVESGGKLSTLKGTVRTAAIGNTSVDSSRAICVPLSRKSSQPSSIDATTDGAGGGRGGDRFRLEGATLDAGTPGSLKPGFLLIEGLTLWMAGICFFVALADRTRLGTEGNLKPVCNVSREAFAGVKSVAIRTGNCVL
jgi:hypothetical protein